MNTTSNISPLIPSNALNETVLNGTKLLTPEIICFVERYRSFAKQTAEAIINLALTLAEAESTLNRVDMTLFCDEVGVERDGSTYRKLKVIAENVSRFEPVIEKLPAAWTTIYKLASLPAADFDKLVSFGVITPYMTTAKITEQLNSKKEDKAGKSSATDLAISLANLSPDIQSKVYDLVFELKAQYHFLVTPDKSLEESIIAFRRSKAA